MAIQVQSTHTGGGTSTAVAVVNTIDGGTDQFFFLAVGAAGNIDVLTVTGGSLTWVEEIEQCSGRNFQGNRLWRAQGSPTGPFSVTVTLAASAPSVSVQITRFSGVDLTAPIADQDGQNTNGANDLVCGGGSDNNGPQLTLTSTRDGSVHVIGANTRNTTISANPNYTSQVGPTAFGTGSNQTTMETFTRLLIPAAVDLASFTSSGAVDWTMVGLVLQPEFEDADGSIDGQSALTSNAIVALAAAAVIAGQSALTSNAIASYAAAGVVAGQSSLTGQPAGDVTVAALIAAQSSLSAKANLGEFLNTGFEILGSSPGLARDWILDSLASVEDIAEFDSAVPETVEDFEEEWSSNEDYLFELAEGFILGALFDQALDPQGVEDFEEGWSQNELYIFQLASIEQADLNTNLLLEFESFETDWQGNNDYLFVFAPTDVAIGQFDTAPQDFEDFEEEWQGNENYLFAFGGGDVTVASFDVGVPQDFEDFEEEWTLTMTTL